MNPGDKAQFILGLNTGEGEIIKENEKTVIVKLPNGKTIKRHKEKHKVRLLDA